MLVVSRKKSESVVIDGRITVTILELRGHNVRLGIDAPADVVIRRDEVQRLLEQNPSRTARASAVPGDQTCGHELMPA